MTKRAKTCTYACVMHQNNVLMHFDALLHQNMHMYTFLVEYEVFPYETRQFDHVPLRDQTPVSFKIIYEVYNHVKLKSALLILCHKNNYP